MDGLKNGTQLPYLVRDAKTQQILGATRYYDLALKHARCFIGYTWYVKSAQGTAVNPEAKLLLLTQAFEHFGMRRVAFMTHAKNRQSQNALKKLGACYEGTLRRHMIYASGEVRDSVVFSIVDCQWPQVKADLIRRLLHYEKN
jgi:RimJ/RimL family protein N-acetyltransferase